MFFGWRDRCPSLLFRDIALLLDVRLKLPRAHIETLMYLERLKTVKCTNLGFERWHVACMVWYLVKVRPSERNPNFKRRIDIDLWYSSVASAALVYYLGFCADGLERRKSRFVVFSALRQLSSIKDNIHIRSKWQSYPNLFLATSWLWSTMCYDAYSELTYHFKSLVIVANR